MRSAAQAIADYLFAGGCRRVFAYPGTSELALTDAIDAHPGVGLVNARGDKEAVFLAAGANALRPGRGVAVVHGARGLTNALGAIADVRRSEVPTIVLVGLPSRRSAPYLPPHGEIGLIERAGAFASAAFEVVDESPGDGLMAVLSQAGAAVQELPFGPVLVGIPQDVLEAPFADELPIATPLDHGGDVRGLGEAVQILRASKRPTILVDDFALRDDGARTDIARLSSSLGAPVLQLAYRRGPMLFEQLRVAEVPRFLGMYDPSDETHRTALEQADLLVTIDDRNMYPRVVGQLPACRKLALTSNGPVTVKNGYLGDGDLLVAGDIGQLLQSLVTAVGRSPTAEATPDDRTQPSTAGRRAGSVEGAALVEALGDALSALPRILVVDDSQMFGGLLALHYESLGPDRVFGSHGGFVGSGLAKAAGMASVADAPVVCCVGDQGFLNGIQALASIAEEHLPVLIVICNNGSSVSLQKQSRHDGLRRMAAGRFLDNSATVDYLGLAAGYGVDGQRVDWRRSAPPADELRAVVERGLHERRPFLVEILTPSSAEFWSGVWATEGMEGGSGAIATATTSVA